MSSIMLKRSLFRTVPALAVVLALSACEADLPTMAAYSDYAWSSQDPMGGDCTPILLTDPTDIPMDAPESVTSAAYQAELAAIAARNAALTGEDRKNMAYWTNNSAIRWNEIALELIAKYNLIPGPNPDGSYTLPDPTNPDGPTKFPFSHPPYAVRALAYMSTAQFDGLIASWHYQFSFDRPAPYQVDGNIVPGYVDNSMPAYPAADAVIAETARRILTAMFPLEENYLNGLAEQHMKALLDGGMHVPSDLEAGRQIAAYVSDLALSRAATDGMRRAQCSKAVSDSIAQAAFDRFGWQWVNRELPQRPVGLVPLYGLVQTWNLPDVLDTRAPMPPAVGSPEYEADVAILLDHEKNLTLDHRMLANFWEDGLGTYTPPGHWNDIAKRYILRDRLNPLRTVRIFCYLNQAMMDAGISCWDSKYYYHYPRPIQNIPDFQTIAGTPNFPSYTSGHSVFSASAAEVLAYAFPDEAETFRQMARDAALSRVVGGIHWTFDATVGTDQGIAVAQYTINTASSDGAD